MMLIPKKNFDLFDDFFDDPFFREERHSRPMQMMKTDIRETDNKYIIDVDLPGFEKENIKVDVEEGYLNINARISKKDNEENKKYIRRERCVGECSRSFYIGEDIHENDIKANFKNGILTLEVPKAKALPKKEEKKYITIND